MCLKIRTKSPHQSKKSKGDLFHLQVLGICILEGSVDVVNYLLHPILLLDEHRAHGHGGDGKVEIEHLSRNQPYEELYYGKVGLELFKGNLAFLHPLEVLDLFQDLQEG